ncbi:MAG: histidinol-phosphate transaminase [Lentisphaerae bacterium]|nr:histidinol-phosphate transaminase [Lentisphaerota bacterium]
MEIHCFCGVSIDRCNGILHTYHDNLWSFCPMKSYFRPEIDAIAGYAPGEQPKMSNLIKLNTNENPYPPSPEVLKVLHNFDPARLRRYPDPTADGLRDIFAASVNMKRENVIIGNGSDDLLTMIFRAFTDKDRSVAVFEPTYSLYPVLAAMQGAEVTRIALDKENFSYPDNAVELAGDANLLIITRPNAPTGNCADKELVRNICRNFDGIVLIDEAYSDFAADNCSEFAAEFDNVLVMRTFSKGSSMAGLRLGYAFGNKILIDGLMKLKDSYNVDMLSQELAKANFLDVQYRAECTAKIIADREKLTGELQKLGFKVIPSQANFLFASPPDGDGAGAFAALREEAVIVRYFPGEITGKYLRITIGTPEENARLLEVLAKRY